MRQNISQRTAQQIVDTVKDVCGQNINYIDISGTIYASTDPSRIGKFHEIGKQVVLTGETIEVSQGESFYGTYAGVNIPIIYKGELTAVIGISGAPEEVRRFGYLAQKITLLLLREQESDYRNNNRKNQMNYIIRSLIDEEHCKNRRIHEYIHEHKIDDSIEHQLVLIKLDSRYNPSNLGLLETSITQMYQSTSSPLYTFNYPNEYILIADTTALSARMSAFQQFASEYEQLAVVSVSSRHGIYEQFRAYQEAKLALKFSKSGNISEYTHLGIEMLCMDQDTDIKELFQKKYLADLSDEERQLLTIYYDHNMSLAETSQVLYIHKNTVQYQLERISKKTGYNPRQFRDAAGFYAALMLET